MSSSSGAVNGVAVANGGGGFVRRPHSFYPSVLSPSHTSDGGADGVGGSYTPSVILLTGGAGFIGSHVVIELLRAHPSYRVIVLDKLDVCASVHNLDEVKDLPNFRLVVGDIGDAVLVRRLLIEERVDTVMHFAAQTHVDNSFGNSIHFTDQNIRGTHLLLETLKSVKEQIRRFIHVSTDEVYGEGEVGSDHRLAEHSALNPTNPYAATKCAAEFLVKSYAISFGIPALITRGNNVFGPHQFPEKVIPKFISLLNQGRPCSVHGTGEHRRSFLYVKDVARAFDVILHRGQTHHIYNIGSSEEMEISNLQLCKTLIALFRQHYPTSLDANKSDADYVVHVKDRAFNDQRYHIDSSELYALGWQKSQIDLTEQLRQCIEWYRAHPSHWPQQVVQAALQPHPFQPPQFRRPSHDSTATSGADGGKPPPLTLQSSMSYASPTHQDLPSIDSLKVNTVGTTADTGLRWLVYGHRGWIGQQVCDMIRKRGQGEDIVLEGVARANDEAGVEDEITSLRPDRIVSLIGRTYGPGYTTIDYLEQKGKLQENINDNLYSPLVLATLAKKHGVHYTYMGTGCIFTYDQQHPLPQHAAQDQTGSEDNTSSSSIAADATHEADELGFTESSKPNFFASSYSTVKGFTDRLMQLQFSSSALNVRIRMPITSDSSMRNFITKITKYERICSISNSMTVLPELLPIMLDMAAAKEVGTVNLTNPGYISHNQILAMYRDIVDPSFTWKNFTQEQQNAILAAGRSNNALSTKRLQAFAPQLLDIHASTRQIMQRIKHDREQGTAPLTKQQLVQQAQATQENPAV
jgi:UDP-glucose 4,6-dehydratase